MLHGNCMLPPMALLCLLCRCGAAHCGHVAASGAGGPGEHMGIAFCFRCFLNCLMLGLRHPMLGWKAEDDPACLPGALVNKLLNRLILGLREGWLFSHVSEALGHYVLAENSGLC